MKRNVRVSKMKSKDIAGYRLVSQRIAGTDLVSAKDMVGRMGAMQAQSYPMVKWALGLRLLNATDRTVEAAIDNGEVIRTHALRPTWHLVSAEDVHWMLELTAPQIRSALRSRHRELELSASEVGKSNRTIERALRDGRHLTRRELTAEFKRAGIPTGDNRGSHLLLLAELDGLVGSGESKGGQPTYALLDERVRKTKSLTREEALATLARKYFSSHWPATLEDFVWWSGLPVRDAKRGMESIRADFISETINSRDYWLSGTVPASASSDKRVYLLPAYDEFLISYKDRSASLPRERRDRAVSSNGIFRPVIVVDGRVVGLWNRTNQRSGVAVSTEIFEGPGSRISKRALKRAAMRFAEFLGKEVTMDP